MKRKNIKILKFLMFLFIFMAYNIFFTSIACAQPNYNITITKDKETVLIHDTVTFVVHPLRDGNTITDILCNITVDGNLYQMNNIDRVFSYTEDSFQSHTFSISSLYDNEYGCPTEFNVTPLTVSWQPANNSVTIMEVLPTEQPEPSPSPEEQSDIKLPEVSQNDAIAIAAAIGIGVVVVLVINKVKVKTKKKKKYKNIKIPKTNRR
jgi:hypothetical protein